MRQSHRLLDATAPIWAALWAFAQERAGTEIKTRDPKACGEAAVCVLEAGVCYNLRTHAVADSI